MRSFKTLFGAAVVGALFMPGLAGAQEARSRIAIDEGAPQSRVLQYVESAQQQSILHGGEVALNLNIPVAWDDSRITPSSAALLDRVAFALSQSAPEARLLIEAHTDSRGGEAYNLALSKRRAEAVLIHLIGAGIPASRMSADGYGEARPLAHTNPGEAINRRAEIVFLN